MDYWKMNKELQTFVAKKKKEQKKRLLMFQVCFVQPERSNFFAGFRIFTLYYIIECLFIISQYVVQNTQHHVESKLSQY